MKLQFIEVTIVTDSEDHLTTPRKGLVRWDQIASVVDVSSAKYSMNGVTAISLEEEVDDYEEGNHRGKVGGVVRGRRKLCVQESYETVKSRIEAACATANS